MMSNEAKDPLLGQTVGAYRLIEPLGRGGMATVYKAHEAALDRYVAVKILPQSLASSDDFIQRFQREAKAIAQLNHPNIVPIYSYGEERNIIYIAMQLVEGGALKREEGQVFPVANALKLLAPIARALDYAHQHGIIHRDIKPSNILLSHQDWPMLADFGLARTTEPSQHLTATGVSMGTPRYMSPEQGRGITVDHRADIYSLGIVLYELVTGEEPFRADTPMGAIVKHITEPLPLPRRTNPNISEEVENIILKAAEKDPAARYQSAGEMAEAMENALNVLISTVIAVPSPQPGVGVLPKPREKDRFENPFTFGNPIKIPSRFIGRKTEMRQIVNRLLSSAHESTSIIGERRIGKTSLLGHLANPEVAAELGLTPDKFCLVYIDFQGLTDITPARFWQRVLKKLSRSISDKNLIPSIEALSEQGDFDLFDLEDLFQSLMDKGLTIVLLMDEFEYVTENQNFKSDFFGGLRALAIHSSVALLPATRRELVDLCHSEEIKGSPFFNIFANVVLRPFSRDEVDQMLDSYTQSSGVVFTSEEKDFVWATGGGYPIFAQMAGYYLVEGKTQGFADQALIEFAVSNFYQQAEAHYSYLWSHCTENEKITLLIVLILAKGGQTKKSPASLENLSKLRSRATQDVASLSKRGLISELDGVFQIFSPSFERWTQKEIIAASGEEESQKAVDDWLTSVEQEEFKEARVVLPRVKKKYWPLMQVFFKEPALKTMMDMMVDFISTL